MYSKVHKTNDLTLLACCDKELVGKTFNHNNIKITLSEKFYGKKITSEKTLEKLLKEADCINLVGEKCVLAALRKGFIKEKDIIRIGKAPHVQIYLI